MIVIFSAFDESIRENEEASKSLPDVVSDHLQAAPLTAASDVTSDASTDSISIEEKSSAQSDKGCSCSERSCESKAHVWAILIGSMFSFFSGGLFSVAHQVVASLAVM